MLLAPASGAECPHEEVISQPSRWCWRSRRRGILGQSAAPSAETATAVPTFELDKTWPPKLPNEWVMGQMSSVAIDKRDHVWLLHRPRFISAEQSAHRAPPVLEFDATGKFVQGWGGPGAGYEWPENEHGIFVDDKDIVWIGGQAGTGAGVVKYRNVANQRVPVDDDMLLKFTTAGKFCSRSAGRTPAVETRNRRFEEPAGLVSSEHQERSSPTVTEIAA